MQEEGVLDEEEGVLDDQERWFLTVTGRQIAGGGTSPAAAHRRSGDKLPERDGLLLDLRRVPGLDRGKIGLG